MPSGEGRDGAILLLIGLVLILNVVIQREYRLLRVVQLLSANCLELRHNRRRVVIGHEMEGADGDEVSTAKRTIGSFRQVSLRDFFNDGLRHKKFQRAALP